MAASGHHRTRLPSWISVDWTTTTPATGTEYGTTTTTTTTVGDDDDDVTTNNSGNDVHDDKTHHNHRQPSSSSPPSSSSSPLNRRRSETAAIVTPLPSRTRNNRSSNIHSACRSSAYGSVIQRAGGSSSSSSSSSSNFNRHHHNNNTSYSSPRRKQRPGTTPPRTNHNHQNHNHNNPHKMSHDHRHHDSATAAAASPVLFQQRKLAKRSSTTARSHNNDKVPPESHLVRLCRQQDWKGALHHVLAHPEDAEPRLLLEHHDGDDYFYTHNKMNQGSGGGGSCSSGAGEDGVYHDTALHLVCPWIDFSPPAAAAAGMTVEDVRSATTSLTTTDHDHHHEHDNHNTNNDSDDVNNHFLALRLVQELLEASPKQAIVSHIHPGHTALRALVRNSTCTAHVLGLLLDTMEEAWKYELLQQQKYDHDDDRTNSHHDKNGHNNDDAPIPSLSQLVWRKQCCQPDRDGLRPLDHIIMAFHHYQQHQQTTTTTNHSPIHNNKSTSSSSSTSQPLDLLKIFVQRVGGGDQVVMGLPDPSPPPTTARAAAAAAQVPFPRQQQQQQQQQQVSLLIRLLSLGNSNSGPCGSPCVGGGGGGGSGGGSPKIAAPTVLSMDDSASSSSPSNNHHHNKPHYYDYCEKSPRQKRSSHPAGSRSVSGTTTQQQHKNHHHRVLEATRYLVQRFPGLLGQPSLTTQCTPLHVALRNYGNQLELIECFLLLESHYESSSSSLPLGACSKSGNDDYDYDGTCTTDHRNEEQQHCNNNCNCNNEKDYHNKRKAGVIKQSCSSGGGGGSIVLSPYILASLRHENQFGDMPLHVACSVGVPVPVLRLVLQGTLQAMLRRPVDGANNVFHNTNGGTMQATTTHRIGNRHHNDDSHHNNLCWTVNHAGYTPIDLEWIRHMEDGKGFFMARSFYPLEAGGIKKTFWKQDEFYRVLLQQAVQQAMDTKPATANHNNNNSSTSRSTSNKCQSHHHHHHHHHHHPARLSPSTCPSRSGSLTARSIPSSATGRTPRPIGAPPPPAPTSSIYVSPFATATTATATASHTVSATEKAAATPSKRKPSPPPGEASKAYHKTQASTTITSRSPPPQPTEQPTWELLLHRIFLIIQTAATQRVPQTQTDLVDYLLHAACKLSIPVMPSLPLPLLELILYMYPEQLLLADHDTSNLPLHYAVQPKLHFPGGESSVHGNRRCPCSSSSSSQECQPQPPPSSGNPTSTRACVVSDNEISSESSQQICNEWESWVKQLLTHGPEACSMRNNLGQLPLHKALERCCCCCCCMSRGGGSGGGCSSSRKTSNNNNSHHHHNRCGSNSRLEMTPQEQVRLNVIRALVVSNPESVNVMDPVTRLMPFQLAASSRYLPLDSVFYLLRRSPDAVLATT